MESVRFYRDLFNLVDRQYVEDHDIKSIRFIEQNPENVSSITDNVSQITVALSISGNEAWIPKASGVLMKVRLMKYDDTNITETHINDIGIQAGAPLISNYRYEEDGATVYEGTTGTYIYERYLNQIAKANRQSKNISNGELLDFDTGIHEANKQYGNSKIILKQGSLRMRELRLLKAGENQQNLSDFSYADYSSHGDSSPITPATLDNLIHGINGMFKTNSFQDGEDFDTNYPDKDIMLDFQQNVHTTFNEGFYRRQQKLKNSKGEARDVWLWMPQRDFATVFEVLPPQFNKKVRHVYTKNIDSTGLTSAVIQCSNCIYEDENQVVYKYVAPRYIGENNGFEEARVKLKILDFRYVACFANIDLPFFNAKYITPLSSGNVNIDFLNWRAYDAGTFNVRQGFNTLANVFQVDSSTEAVAICFIPSNVKQYEVPRLYGNTRFNIFKGVNVQPTNYSLEIGAGKRVPDNCYHNINWREGKYHQVYQDYLDFFYKAGKWDQPLITYEEYYHNLFLCFNLTSEVITTCSNVTLKFEANPPKVAISATDAGVLGMPLELPNNQQNNDKMLQAGAMIPHNSNKPGDSFAIVEYNIIIYYKEKRKLSMRSGTVAGSGNNSFTTYNSVEKPF